MIYALKEGKVVEYGTHDELMKKRGYYTRLIKTEIKKEIFGLKDSAEKKKEIAIKEMPITYGILKRQTMRMELVNIEERDIPIKICTFFELVKDKKLDIFISILGGLIYGGVIPLTSLFLGELTTAFALKDNSEMKKRVLKWALILFLIVFVGAVCNYFKALKLGVLGSAVVSKIRKNLFLKYLQLHMGFYDYDYNNPNGLISILSVEVSYLKLFFTTILSVLTILVGIIITALIIGFYYDWKLTLILLGFFPIRVIISIFSGKFKVGGTRKYKKVRIEASNHFSECVTNTRTIFSFNFQKRAIEMYKNILKKENKDYIKDSLIYSVLIAAGDYLSYISNSVAYKCAMVFIRHRSLTFRVMNNVKKTLMSYIEGTDIFIRGISDFSKVKIAYKCIYRILNTLSEINAFEEENKDKEFPENFEGKIEFRNVSFFYPTKPNIKILKNVSFVIPPWSKAAFVGNSESGKSTIIQLIERFYDIYNGEILIDDINIKRYNLYKLRKKIGLITHDPVLFKRGLYENILYGRLDASREEVFKAANKSSIDKFLNDKEFNLKENASSQGEKQRISMARVFLKNPKILILDNVTSFLDKESEKEIKNKINEFQKGRTSISITHRLSNIVNYDVIFFMENGKLVEQGTHDELLEKKGKYYELYKISEK